MISRLHFEDERGTRYAYYDSNTGCVYVGRSAVGLNEFVVFTADEWRCITAFHVEQSGSKEGDDHAI